LDHRLSSHSFSANDAAVLQSWFRLVKKRFIRKAVKYCAKDLDSPVGPHEFPETKVVELGPNVLRLPGLGVPLDGGWNVSVDELEAALEKQEPHSLRVFLKYKMIYQLVTVWKSI